MRFENTFPRYVLRLLLWIILPSQAGETCNKKSSFSKPAICTVHLINLIQKFKFWIVARFSQTEKYGINCNNIYACIPPLQSQNFWQDSLAGKGKNPFDLGQFFDGFAVSENE